MHNDPEIDQILAEQQRQRNRRRLRLLGIVALAIVAMLVLAFVSEPFLRRTRSAGQESSAIGSLRAVMSAQMVFALSCGGYYATRLTQLGQPAGLGGAPLSADLTFTDRVEKSGYQIWIDAQPAADGPSCNGLGAGQVARSFVVRAEPLPGEGGRFFATSSDGADVYQSSESVRFVDGTVTGGATPVR